MLSSGIDLATLPLREAARLGRRAQTELARALARTAAAVPESRMRQAMQTPLRRFVLDALFRALAGVLADTRADEVTTAVRCHVTGRPDGTYDVYWIEFVEERWRTRRGGGAEADAAPELTITVDGVELVRLATGRTNALGSLLTGRLRATGDPDVAARVMSVLRARPVPRGAEAGHAGPATDRPGRAGA